MELPSKILERTAFNTRPKIEEHMLVVMSRSNHKEHSSQQLQTNKKHYKVPVTFLTGYNGFLMLQTKILNSISQNQLLTKMVLSKLPYHLVLTKLKVRILKLKGILLLKKITPNQLIHLKSNQNFQH